MSFKRLKIVACSALCVLIFLLAACGDTNTKSETGQVPGGQGATSTASGAQTGKTPNSTTGSTAATAVATVITGASTPGVGPKIINTPSPVPGGSSKSQNIPLKDRTLIINDVAKQKGNDATTVSIVLTLTIKNTSAQAIKNQPDFFQLVGSEGDTFGKQSNSSDTFYGAVDANGQRKGTIVFQIPAAAAKNLRLMYRPEVLTETVFTSLNV